MLFTTTVNRPLKKCHMEQPIHIATCQADTFNLRGKTQIYQPGQRLGLRKKKTL